MNKYDTKIFVEKAKFIHKNKYNYSKTKYVNSRTKVIITCPIHGDFEQLAANHIRGKGCPKCNKGGSPKMTKDEFIKEAKRIHRGYNYSKVEYYHSKEKVEVICPIHGMFKITPDHHLRGVGCPLCNSSKGEILIEKWLKDHNIPFKFQFVLEMPEIARCSNTIIIDFFVKYQGKQYFIEFDGEQHFNPNHYFYKDGGYIEQVRRDKVLNKFCEEHKDKVSLLRIKYNLTEEEIKSKLCSEFGVS